MENQTEMCVRWQKDEYKRMEQRKVTKQGKDRIYLENVKVFQSTEKRFFFHLNLYFLYKN